MTTVGPEPASHAIATGLSEGPSQTGVASDREVSSSWPQRETVRGYGDRKHYDYDDRLDGISKLRCILSTAFRPSPDMNDEHVVREAAGARFPACATSSRNFKRDPVLSERLRDALIYGYQHVGARYESLYRRSPGTNPLTRSEAILFAEELRQLDRVLGHVWTDRSSSVETTYFIDEKDYNIVRIHGCFSAPLSQVRWAGLYCSGVLVGMGG
ncbi:hypothetical protein NUW54_g11473 [Trametes sanguinea]|uniref:Uncharacterized protein n=1 Tax=Trametes sanguinea TaxID=158606 RepID=A0ACC1NCI4_9APHY|nr:hypothetical protein NUW54_g11473 [Trametes sanguinea]